MNTAIASVRPERVGDIEAIRAVNVAAFGGDAEARLVDALRERDKLVVSLVAELDAGIAGHIAFSRVLLERPSDVRGIGLGPMAVQPSSQRRGIGSVLVNAGLRHCRDLGYDFAVVLGHPNYYPRFGFEPAGRFHLRCIWEVPDDVFMVCELRPGILKTISGLVNYEPEFNLVT